MNVHPTAIVDPSAELGPEVEIGPFCCIGPDTVIGEGTIIDAHAVIKQYTRIGKFCKISEGVVLGAFPQDSNFAGEYSSVELGNYVTVRECATIHRATGEGKKTVVGNHCMIMAYVHLGHNVKLGEGVTLVNTVQLAGHVELADHVFLGGGVLVHQFVKIGKLAMVGAHTYVDQDVPPFALVSDHRGAVYGINVIGLKRHGINAEGRTLLKRAYALLMHSNLNREQAIMAIEAQLEPHPFVEELVDFIRHSKRGVRFRNPKKNSQENSQAELYPISWKQPDTGLITFD